MISLNRKETICPRWVTVTVGEAIVMRHTAAFNSLINLPYWPRLWIIQEIMLAQDIIVLSGRKKVNWKRLTTCTLYKEHHLNKIKYSPEFARIEALIYGRTTRKERAEYNLDWKAARRISRSSLCSSARSKWARSTGCWI